MGQAKFGATKIPIRIQSITSSLSISSISVTGKCGFGGVIIKTDGNNDVTIDIYDGLSATGAQLIPDSTVIPGS